MEVETRLMGTQAKEGRQPLEATKGKEWILS